jgi:hypothetical protein
MQGGKGSAKFGGSKLIFPLLGQEVFARVQLSRNEIVFDLNNLLTYETIRVNLIVVIYWRVGDLDTLVSEFCPNNSGDPDSQGEEIVWKAGDFLKITTGRMLRSLVAKKSISIPALAKMSKSLERSGNKQNGIQVRIPFEEKGALDLDINEILRLNLERVADEYGIKIEEIVLDFSLPQEIHAAIEETWQSSLLPVASAHEALAKEIKIRSLAGLIGIEATTMNELWKNFRGASLLGQIPFIDFLEKRTPESANDERGDDSRIRIRKRGDEDD